jgi:hypothetical protein
LDGGAKTVQVLLAFFGGILQDLPARHRVCEP